MVGPDGCWGGPAAGRAITARALLLSLARPARLITRIVQAVFSFSADLALDIDAPASAVTDLATAPVFRGGPPAHFATSDLSCPCEAQ